MATFGPSDDLNGATFVEVSLRAARFVRSDLAGVVMRGVDIAGADLDAPWLLDGRSTLFVNGVDVAPLVDAELDRRFPGRALRRSSDPAGLRDAWATVEKTWAATLVRVGAMPTGTEDASVAGEWSLSQTLRHLIMATDTWLGRAILERERPFHPIGRPNIEYESDGNDMTVFQLETPTYSEVLEVRARRVAMVRDYLATVTAQELAAPRRNPWSPDHTETVASCLHTLLEEEWEHHRYAVRDLDTLTALPGNPTAAHGTSPDDVVSPEH